MLVFKAHITTSPAGKVADIFWIYDHRSELPDNHRQILNKIFHTLIASALAQQLNDCDAAKRISL